MNSPVFLIFALAFTIGMCIYWLGSFFIIYHLIRFGVSALPKKLAVLFLGGAIVLSLVATLLFTQVDFNSLSIQSIDFTFPTIDVTKTMSQ